MGGGLKRKASASWGLVKKALQGRKEQRADDYKTTTTMSPANTPSSASSSSLAMATDAVTHLLTSMTLKDDLLPLLQSLHRCDSSRVDLDELVISGTDREAEAETETNTETEAAHDAKKASLSLLQDLHRGLASARFSLGMYTFFLPWVGSMAVSGLSVAAACVGLFPVWLGFEAGFYLYLAEKRRKLLCVDKHDPIPKEDCVKNLQCIVKTLVDLCQSSHPDLSTTFISDWFNGASAEEITRQDALQWMSQSFMFQDFQDLETEEERETVGEVTTVVERLLRHKELYGPDFSFKTGERKLDILRPGFNICGHYE